MVDGMLHYNKGKDGLRQVVIQVQVLVRTDLK